MVWTSDSYDWIGNVWTWNESLYNEWGGWWEATHFHAVKVRNFRWWMVHDGSLSAMMDALHGYDERRSS